MNRTIVLVVAILLASCGNHAGGATGKKNDEKETDVTTARNAAPPMRIASPLPLPPQRIRPM